MNTSYVKIMLNGFNLNLDMLVWGNGKKEWCKNLTEFTSYIGVQKNPNDAISLKQSFCRMISEDIGKPFTIEDLDKIVTKKHYRQGMAALREYEFIVDTNVACVKQGKEPKYHATSLAGHIAFNHLLKELKQ
jgi:hypothetical protein